VFPLKPRGKEPLTVHGFKDASTDPQQIAAWWQQWPDANVGLPTGSASGRIVVDMDPRAGGDESLDRLIYRHGRYPETAEQMTGGGGRHIFFAHTDGVRCKTLAPGLDLKGEGGYVVVAPSTHPNGNAYQWDGLAGVKALLTPAAPPAWLLESGAPKSQADVVEGRIPRGQRNSTLTSLAGSMRRRGMSEAAILAALTEENRARCEPALSQNEVRQIARSVGRYEHEAALPRKAERLAEVIQTFERWLHLPDPGAVQVVLAAIAGNRTDGDPLWLMVIGPPGCGKTEVLQSTAKLPGMYPTGVLTEAALLSGTAARDRDRGAKGGLLRQIGTHGTILCKDFGSVLSMHRDARTPLLAGLREIYDGEWTRRLGVEGGRTLTWRGRVGLLGGCTPAIDSHHGVLSIMGERFLFYRVETPDAIQQAGRALAHGGREVQMRRELVAAVNGLFDKLIVPPIQEVLDDAARSRIVRLAAFAARCRSAVERDGYSREITLIPGAEAPGRLALCLGRLLAGLVGVGVDEATLWRLVTKVAVDCMPMLRRQVLAHLYSHRAAADTSTVAVMIHYPTGTTRRGLEDLAAYGVVSRESRGSGNADLWRLSSWAFNELQAIEPTFPEK
jgi:hypothetical protein